MAEKTPKYDLLIKNVRVVRPRKTTVEKMDIAVIGGKELEERTVALQNQAGEKLGTLPVDAFVARILDEIAKKTLPAHVGAATT